jgi:hypothetical protein
MTAVPDQTTIQQYVANGVSTIYSYNFLILAATDIVVYVTPVGQTPDPTVDIQILNTDYQVFNVGNVNGGTIQFYAPHTPAIGSIITVARGMPFSLDTEFVQAQNFSGANLDLAFERVILLIQQLASQLNLRQLQYVFDSFLAPGSNKLPVITDTDNQIWISQGGQIVAGELSESPDWSTLRAQLAVNTSGGGAGASLVGYYDAITNAGRNVNTFLISVQDKTNGTYTHGGADLLGYYDSNTSTSTTIGAFLAAGGTAIPAGAIIDFGGPQAISGYLLCDGTEYSRSTYASLFNAITFTQTCTLTDMSETVITTNNTIMYGGATALLGMAVTGTNIPTGTYITAVTNDGVTITLSQAATATGSSDLTFYPWGAGDGTTTFNVPNLPHHTTIGWGGTPAAHTGMSGTVTGQRGGEETHTQLAVEIASHTHTGTVGAAVGISAGNSSLLFHDTPPTGQFALSINNFGSAQPFNVTQLSAVVTKMIKT